MGLLSDIAASLSTDPAPTRSTQPSGKGFLSSIANSITTKSDTTAALPENDVTPEGLRQLRLDESGGRDYLKAYRDSKGIPTIGVGFNLAEPANHRVFEDVTGFTAAEAIAGKPITVDQQDELLAHTVASAERDAHKLIPKLDDLPPHAQDAITNFVFNTGFNTASQFKNTLAAINRGDGKAAAAGIRASAYYRQVGARGERVAKAIESIGAPK